MLLSSSGGGQGGKYKQLYNSMDTEWMKWRLFIKLNTKHEHEPSLAIRTYI